MSGLKCRWIFRIKNWGFTPIYKTEKVHVAALKIKIINNQA